MKTLDEVIKALETDPVPMAYTARLSVHEDIMTDALHYLKEYRKTQMAYIKAMADLEDNPALTWDELKQMEGKPVWVEVDDRKEWGILSDFYTDMFHNGKVTIRIRDAQPFRLCEKMLGKTWNAYRKERNGADS